MKKKYKRLSVFLVCCTAILIIACFFFGKKHNDNNSKKETAEVIRRNFNSTVLATGVIKPQVGAEVRVGARISGKVERLHTNIGDTVKKGQIIAELEKADLEAVVLCAHARVKVAEAKVMDAVSRQKLADTRHNRLKNLIKKNVISQADVDKTLKEKESAKAGILLMQGGVDVAKAILKELQVRLSYATITAPIEGVIASVSTQEGETVAAGLSAPTFVTIIDLDRLQVDAYVDEVDIGKIKIGQKAFFTVDAFPSREFQGKIVSIYPKAVIQENVVNYDVVLDIATPYSGLLRPEMTASVTFLLKEKVDALALPIKVVKRDKGKNIVFLLSDGKVERREVKVGWKDSQWIEILSGLKEGDSVLCKRPMEFTP